MKYVNLGRSGLKVSRLCLGCMSYGEPERLPQPWSLDEKASRPLIRQALEAGINFFDTANIYSGGSSEEDAGPVLRHLLPRIKRIITGTDMIPRLLKQLRIGIQHIGIIVNQQNRTVITQHLLHPSN